MLEFLEKYSRNIFSSQWGEEGVCLEIARRLNLGPSSVACDIGSHNGSYCSNTALLIRDYGWSGTLIEANPDLYERCKSRYADNPKVTVINARVGPENVNSLVPDPCDLLSIDVDSCDYQIFQALTTKPQIVIIEIDSSMPLDRGGFNADGAASYREMVNLAYIKDYFLLAHTGNCIFIDEKYHHLFPEIDIDPLAFPERYFNPAVLSGDRTWLNR